ncbi:MAG: hypothetical protein K0U34_02385 [Alphaproteobacteria bacterium]|nr:hypothetical protein [Alphaproteobacteria bacterium]
MKTFVIATVAGAVLSIATFGAAQAETLSAKIMSDHPGISDGRTVNPTARPDDNAGGLQRKAMQDHPGTAGGKTQAPLARVDADSIQGAIRIN